MWAKPCGQCFHMQYVRLISLVGGREKKKKRKLCSPQGCTPFQFIQKWWHFYWPLPISFALCFLVACDSPYSLTSFFVFCHLCHHSLWPPVSVSVATCLTLCLHKFFSRSRQPCFSWSSVWLFGIKKLTGFVLSPYIIIYGHFAFLTNIGHSSAG